LLDKLYLRFVAQFPAVDVKNTLLAEAGGEE